MLRWMLGRGTIVGVVLGAVLVLAPSASATTICVPNFDPSRCPSGGGNVTKTDLEEAMSFQGSDGQADEIRLAAGVHTESAAPFEPAGGSGETLEPGGSDPLTIAGADTESTIVTSSATANAFVVNLNFNNSRAITMRDLTVRVPAGMPDGLGAAFQLDGDVLEGVDIVSLNDESDGIASVIGPGNVFRGGEVRGESGGSIGDGLRGSAAVDGSLLVDDAVVRGASWALVSSDSGSTLTVRRTDVIGARTYGAIVLGGTVNVENSRMTIDDGVGLYASASSDPAALSADHVTVLNSGATNPAVDLEKSGGAADVSMTVTNSILRGFSSGYKVNAVAGPGIGHATLKARYSNFSSSGTSSGILDITGGNIDADPMLNPDLSLPPGSPSIDAGNPAPGGLIADFLGAPRPRDGNGDGSAIRDQGAFEYQPPVKDPEPREGPDPGPARPQAPQTTIAKGPGKALAQGTAKFRFRSSKGGSTFTCKLDKRKAARCKSPTTYRGLKPGKHLFKVWATDAAGSKDPTPALRAFRVPAG